MIKGLIFFVFILSTACGFSQEINQTDENGKKQGVWKKTYKGNALRYEGRFKDDLPVGLFKHYYPSGKIKVKIHYKDLNSYASIYYETGELQATGKYVSQKKDSAWTYYHKNGKTMQEEFYFSNKLEGSWKVYYENGNLAEEKEFSRDIEDGEWKTYFKSGQLKMKSNYVNGRVEGEQWYYTTSGKPKLLGHLHHGARDGFWIYYNPDGTTLRKEEYKNGARVDAGKDDGVINDNNVEREKLDFLEFEDLFPPR